MHRLAFPPEAAGRVGLPPPRELVFPLTADLTETWYVGELAVAYLLELERESVRRCEVFWLRLRDGSQPHRKLDLLGLLGPRAEDSDGVSLWSLDL